jgi:hypothetical protein
MANVSQIRPYPSPLFVFCAGQKQIAIKPLFV